MFNYPKTKNTEEHNNNEECSNLTKVSDNHLNSKYSAIDPVSLLNILKKEVNYKSLYPQITTESEFELALEVITDFQKLIYDIEEKVHHYLSEQ